MAFIEPMYLNKPNITYLLTCHLQLQVNLMGALTVLFHF